MPKIVAYTDIEAPGLRVWVETAKDEQGHDIEHYWVAVGYALIGDEGSKVNRDARFELEPAASALGMNLLRAVKDVLLAQEGIS